MTNKIKKIPRAWYAYDKKILDFFEAYRGTVTGITGWEARTNWRKRGEDPNKVIFSIYSPRLAEEFIGINLGHDFDDD